MEKFKILIISVGSLLGQNILDALEGRRDKVEIIGINTIAENPRVFRCDRLYKAVNSNSLEFESIFLDILTACNGNNLPYPLKTVLSVYFFLLPFYISL